MKKLNRWNKFRNRVPPVPNIFENMGSGGVPAVPNVFENMDSGVPRVPEPERVPFRFGSGSENIPAVDGPLILPQGNRVTSYLIFLPVAHAQNLIRLVHLHYNTKKIRFFGFKPYLILAKTFFS